MSRCVCILICLSLSIASARAQEVPAESSGPSVETVRLALRAERLRLTDAWLLHEDAEERRALRVGRWLAFTAHSVLGLGWGAMGVGALTDDNYPPAASIAAFSAAAVTLTMGGVARAIKDDRDGARWSERAMLLQLAMMGSGLLVMQHTDNSSNPDGKIFLSTVAAQLLIGSVTLTILHVANPTLYISEHYEDYRARPATERDEYGLSLLLEREKRQRIAAYTGFSLGVLNASLYGTAAFMVENPAGRPYLGLLAGGLLINAVASLLINLFARTPSDSILLGLPPPADK